MNMQIRMTARFLFNCFILMLMSAGFVFAQLPVQQQQTPPTQSGSNGEVPGVRSTKTPDPRHPDGPDINPNPGMNSRGNTLKVDASEAVRIRAAEREWLAKSLTGLRQSGEALLKANTDNQLTAKTLIEHSKAINKQASTVRNYWKEGADLPKVQLHTQKISTPEEFDDAIGALAKLVKRFVETPVLTNSGVLDIKERDMALHDLAAILAISKLIEKNSTAYQPKSK